LGALWVLPVLPSRDRHHAAAQSAWQCPASPPKDGCKQWQRRSVLRQGCTAENVLTNTGFSLLLVGARATFLTVVVLLQGELRLVTAREHATQPHGRERGTMLGYGSEAEAPPAAAVPQPCGNGQSSDAA